MTTVLESAAVPCLLYLRYKCPFKNYLLCCAHPLKLGVSFGPRADDPQGTLGGCAELWAWSWTAPSLKEQHPVPYAHSRQTWEQLKSEFRITQKCLLLFLSKAVWSNIFRSFKQPISPLLHPCSMLPWMLVAAATTMHKNPTKMPRLLNHSSPALPWKLLEYDSTTATPSLALVCVMSL